MAADIELIRREVAIPLGGDELPADLTIPARPVGAVVFAHGSGSSRRSVRNVQVARRLNVAGLATLLFDLLTPDEELDRANVFDVPLLAGRLEAATAWGGPAHRRHVREGLAGSYERLFHEVGIPRFMLPLRTDAELAAAVAGPHLERAIGVIYAPETERRSHYFRAHLSRQFDYVLHFDETRAVEPLERTAAWEEGEIAETFPSGL